MIAVVVAMEEETHEPALGAMKKVTWPANARILTRDLLANLVNAISAIRRVTSLATAQMSKVVVGLRQLITAVCQVQRPEHGEARRLIQHRLGLRLLDRP